MLQIRPSQGVESFDSMWVQTVLNSPEEELKTIKIHHGTTEQSCCQKGR